MDDKHRTILTRCMFDFGNSLNPDDILLYLMSKEIISVEDYQKLENAKNRRAKVTQFITTLQTKGPNAFKYFMEALYHHPQVYSHLVTKINSKLDEYEVEKNKTKEQTQWTPMDLYQRTAMEDCTKLLNAELPFEAACEHFLTEGLLKKENIDFMKEVPEVTSRRSFLMAYVKGKGLTAYQSLLTFLGTSCPELKRAILESEEKIKMREVRFQEQVSFDLKHGRVESYLDVPRPINIVVIGKTGSGKSATANTIVGAKGLFKEIAGTNSGTKTVQKADTEQNGVKISILDTPGLFDTSRVLSNADIILEIMKTAQEFPQGIHVFLFVCRGDIRFTKEEMDTFDEIEKNFGESLLKHCILVITHANTFLDEASLQEHLYSNERLCEIFHKVREKAVAVENSDSGNDLLITSCKKREQLLHAIVDLVTYNKGKVYSSSLFEESKRELENEKKKAGLYETIDDLIFKCFIFDTKNEFPYYDKDSISSSQTEMLLSKLTNEDRSLIKESTLRKMILASYEDQQEVIQSICEQKKQGKEQVRSIRQEHPDKTFPHSIMHYVVQCFQNIPDEKLDDLDEHKSLPEQQIQEIFANSPFKTVTNRKSEIHDCTKKCIDEMVKAFKKKNQRHELVSYIHKGCSEVMKEYFMMISYRERKRIIYNYINAGVLPPDLHCKCLKSIPEKFKAGPWDKTIERSLFKTVNDRINTENAILKSVMMLMKNGSRILAVFSSSLYDLIDDPSEQFNLFWNQGVKDYFSHYWEVDSRTHTHVQYCSECRGRHFKGN